MWAACFGFVTCHEADVLRERDVGHVLVQQAEGWSNLQSLLPSHPKSRFDSLTKQAKHTKFCLGLMSIYRAKLMVLFMSPSPSAGCGGSISSWNGSITSPYYPSYYPPNIDCTWTVRVSHMTVCVPVCEW